MTESRTDLSDAAAEARHLDATDTLAHFRNEFAHPKSASNLSTVYLCGNSLGLMPLGARALVQQELDDWANLAVRGHFKTENPWMSYHHRARPLLAALTGGLETELVAMNSLTVNLHLMLVSFFRPADGRTKILIEKDAFPSDRFAVESQLRWHGLDPKRHLVEWAARPGEHALHTEDFEKLLAIQGNEIALVLLPGVQYYTGQVLDMPSIAALAQQHKITVGLDLAHAIGNVPLALHDWNADFAVWCSYKYLNGGPGAVGGAFVHDRHTADDSRPRLLGWWGNDERTRFAMGPEYERANGVDAWQLSNQAIFSLAPVIASLEVFADAGIDSLRDKSIRMTRFLEKTLQQTFADQLKIITPPQAEQRGCQLSLMAQDLPINGRELYERLKQLNVIVDWREPDVIRVAPAPLYNSYRDTVDFVDRLSQAATQRLG